MERVGRETVLLCHVTKCQKLNEITHVAIYRVYIQKKTLTKETHSYKQLLIIDFIDHLQIVLPNITKLE